MPVTIVVDAILFDLDGTLINSRPGAIKAWHTFGRDYGFDAEAAIASAHGMRLWDSLRQWCHITSEETLRDEADRFEREVVSGGVVALPGVHALLDQLRAGSTSTIPGWTIVTNANDVTHGKPHPAPYLMGARSLNVDPKNCLVVEDAVNGILSGKAAGARVLAPTTSSPRDVVSAAGPDWIIPDLTYVSVEWVNDRLEVTIHDE